MKITREADYAVRVVYTIMQQGGKISAREISENSGVTQRFALKILHKLTAAGIVQSYKGVNGGFALAEAGGHLHGEIIECIDGPLRSPNACARTLTAPGSRIKESANSVRSSIG